METLNGTPRDAALLGIMKIGILEASKEHIEKGASVYEETLDSGERAHVLKACRIEGHELFRETGWVYPRATRTPRIIDELLAAFVSVCQTLAFAHSRKVIHCDLKGSNVKVGEFGEVVVLVAHRAI